MTIRNIYNRRRPIIAATIVPLLLLLLELPLEAMPIYQEKPTVRNVQADFDFEKDIATITYDLIAKPGETYEVFASLVKEGDPEFRIPLKSSTGDIGVGKFAGNGRRIQWEFKKDLPKDFVGGPGYSVEITARWVEEGGGGSWVYYVLGGALVAGGVVFLARPKTSESSTASTQLPSTPPGRPF
jgi:hypothetical protein